MMEVFANKFEWGESAGRLAYNHIRRAIVSVCLPGGAHISPVKIAKQLGISTIPVREALRRLQAEGLITVLPNRRSIVTVLTIHDLAELFEMRCVLEGLAARHAVTVLTAADLSELYTLATSMLKAKDLQTYLVKHEAFHDLIAARAGMGRLRRELARLREILTPYIRMYGATQHKGELVKQTHLKLVAQLRKREPHIAERAFVAHTLQAKKQLQETVEALKREGIFAKGGRKRRPGTDPA